MMRLVPTLSQIKAHVALVRRKLPTASRLAIHVAGQWLGERTYSDSELTYRIEVCHSPLALRIALREILPPKTIQVILTHLDPGQLSDDILLRLAKRRVFTLDPWQMALSLFQAQSLDPRIRPVTWLADYLIETPPNQGYPPAVSGFLAAETVWSLVLGQILNLNSDRPDLLTLLHWSLNSQHITSYQGLAPHQQTAIDHWLTENGGQTVAFLLKVWQSPKPGDSLALGLVLPVLYHLPNSQTWDRAIGKLEERYFQGNSPNSVVVRQWQQATEELLASRLIDSQQEFQVVHRADEILAELDTQQATYFSPWSRTGLEERLKTFAHILHACFTAPSLEQLQDLTEQFDFLKNHRHAQSPPFTHRWQCLEMARRLAQWWITARSDSEDLPTSLPTAIAQELKEGCFLDWSRLKLRNGDRLQELEKVYYFILDKVTQIREKQAENFARLYQQALSDSSFDDSMLLIEQVLENVVVPLAQQSPILIIVLDGMGLAIAQELLTQILATQEWTLNDSLSRETGLLAALAPLPSITEVSRTSLLCGNLQTGKAHLEKKQFSSHPLLLPLGRAKYPPRLFHKDALGKVEAGYLAEEVRSQIAAKNHHIVAVVVNAIDDALSKTDQVDICWSDEMIKPLITLLHEANHCQRQVILASDHGHILEMNTQYHAALGGERWRSTDQPPQTGELLTKGTRVLLPEEQALIAPWTEKIRYGPKKTGYHGGLNPQEVLAPIMILSPSLKTHQKNNNQEYYPDWWFSAIAKRPLGHD